MDPAATQKHFDQLNRVLRAVETAPFPVIAMVHGFAVGGGCELAASCDLRIAGSSARIGVPIGRFGHCPDRENLQRLLRLISPAHIRAMIMTDTLFDAGDAHRMGFFNWVVPDASLETFTLAMATTISQKSPLGLRALKRALAEVLDGSIAHAEKPEEDLITGHCGPPATFRKGLRRSSSGASRSSRVSDDGAIMNDRFPIGAFATRRIGRSRKR